MNELYQRLGVAPSATADEVKKAYRKLAKQYHPDLHPDDPQAERQFKEINEAYEILGEPEKRKQYDSEQKASTQASGGRQKKTQTSKTRTPRGGPVDLSQMGGFAQFFGFDPQTGEVTNEDKLSGKSKAKNPMDVSDLFDRFMGFK